jgi:chromosome segregation ATPase
MKALVTCAAIVIAVALFIGGYNLGEKGFLNLFPPPAPGELVDVGGRIDSEIESIGSSLDRSAELIEQYEGELAKRDGIIASLRSERERDARAVKELRSLIAGAGDIRERIGRSVGEGTDALTNADRYILEAQNLSSELRTGLLDLQRQGQ